MRWFCDKHPDVELCSTTGNTKCFKCKQEKDVPKGPKLVFNLLRKAYAELSDMSLCDSAPHEQGIYRAVEEAVIHAKAMGWNKED